MSEQCNDILRELESWYGTDKGKYVLAQTRERLQPYLETAFGYHILQIGPARGLPLHNASLINHRIYASQCGGEGVDLICCDEEIPLEGDSIDVVIAHHSLEFTANPHQVLREIQRVLTPHGHLLLVGFNPYSVHGITSRIRGLSAKSLWHWHRPVGEPRMRDWLHLLGCEVNDTSYLYSMPVTAAARLAAWLSSCGQWFTHHKVPLGGLYLIHAIKQVPAQNRPRRSLRQRSGRLIGLAVPKPGAAASASGTRNSVTAAKVVKISDDSGESSF